MNNKFEPILIPYCKFQNGYPPKWSYSHISGQGSFSSPGFIFGYCSIFRDKYAIYGQYHYHARDKNLVFGVLNKKMESVENAIYSSLNFYPGASNCFIGILSTNQKIEKQHLHQVFFNVSNNYWVTGFSIIPITNKLLVVENLYQEIKLVTTEGKLISKLPFYVNKDGQAVPCSRSSMEFQKAIIYRDNGFSIRYYNIINNSFYIDEDEMELVDSYYELNYNFDFDNEGNLLYQGENSTFDKLAGYSFNEFDETIWLPKGLLELSFMEVQSELFEQKLISSDQIYNEAFWRAKVYKFQSGTKYWEPKLDDFHTLFEL